MYWPHYEKDQNNKLDVRGNCNEKYVSAVVVSYSCEHHSLRHANLKMPTLTIEFGCLAQHNMYFNFQVCVGAGGMLAYVQACSVSDLMQNNVCVSV